MNPVPKLDFFSEVLGLTFDKRCYEQAKLALLGDPYIPKARAGLSSLALLSLRLGLPLWRGRPFLDKKILIINLFNHKQTPIEAGWSIQKTQVQDFRGKRLTYDSHNGTDFAIPVGTPVLSAAAGKVVWVANELNRGGRKIFIDHGEGLMTTYAHLARNTVKVGDEVEQGQQIAWSGYSGLDAVISFPFGIPHVHFNVWFNGVPIDPFSNGSTTSCWIGEYPSFENSHHVYRPSQYNSERVDAGIAMCRDERIRKRLEMLPTLEARASGLLVQQNYYPTRFQKHLSPYIEQYTRSPRLRVPFGADAFNAIVFRDEV